ncbi:MAG: DivIVA domain-containing protein [Actinomycetota bacterium]|nr:DivIVA domain-containing protein [Actinomycetota bacterium]
MSDNPLIPQSSERLSPNEIASKTFTVTRRGFKPEEVNRYLALIGTYVAEQHRLYDLLAAKMKSHISTPPPTEIAPTPKLDLASITSALGEEAAEILKSATAASDSIRAKANEYSRSVREAADIAVAEKEAAHRLEMSEELRIHREEIDRITQEANTKITSEVQRAEELARTLVQEARYDADSIVRKAKEVRAEVYAEIDRRTNEAREVLQLIEAQKEQLTGELRGVKLALDALLGQVDPTFEDTPSSIRMEESQLDESVSVVDEIPDEDSKDGQIVVSEAFAEEDSNSIDQPPGEDLASKSSAKVLYFDDTDGLHETSIEEQVSRETPRDEVVEKEVSAGRGGLGRWPSLRAEPDRSDPVEEAEIRADDIAGDGDFTDLGADFFDTDALEQSEPSITSSNSDSANDKRHGDHFVVEDIFSRLLERSENELETPRNVKVVEVDVIDVADQTYSQIKEEVEASDDVVASDFDGSSTQRPESLQEAISAMYGDAFSSLRSQATRRIKRVVQDDQNALLEGLRIGGADEARRIVSETQEIARAYSDVMASFVQPIVEQSSRYFSQIQLIQGAGDGKWNVSVKPSVEMRAAVDELALELAEEVASRVQSVIGTGMGDDLAALSTRLGATFRELKTEFVETLVSDMISILVSTWLITCTDVAKVTWVRSGEGGCADCEDNELEGIIDVGSNFPTGNPAPPAHIGCRCLLVPYFA